MKQSASQADQTWAAHRATAMSWLPTGSWLRRSRTREWQLPRRFPPSDRASTRMEAASEPQSQPFMQSATCGREYVCSLNTRRRGRVRSRTQHNLALDAPGLNEAAGGSGYLVGAATAIPDTMYCNGIPSGSGLPGVSQASVQSLRNIRAGLPVNDRLRTVSRLDAFAYAAC